MSEQARWIALQEAVKHSGGTGTATEVVTNAKAFLPFLLGDGAGAKASTAAAEEPAPKKTAKPAASKPTKASKSEDELAQEALDAADAEEDAPEEEAAPSKEAVGDLVNKLLKAGKRAQAIGLLKQFKAKSVSEVKPKDFKAFLVAGNKLLVADEAEEEADLEA